MFFLCMSLCLTDRLFYIFFWQMNSIQRCLNGFYPPRSYIYISCLAQYPAAFKLRYFFLWGFFFSPLCYFESIYENFIYCDVTLEIISKQLIFVFHQPILAIGGLFSVSATSQSSFCHIT